MVSQQLREKILVAAIGQLGDNVNATTKAIATAAGHTSQSIIHYCFDTKERLIVEAYKHYCGHPTMSNVGFELAMIVLSRQIPELAALLRAHRAEVWDDFGVRVRRYIHSHSFD